MGKLSTIGLSLLTGLALAIPAAHADEVDAPAWNAHKIKVTAGKGYTKVVKGTSTTGEYIVTSGPDKAGNTSMVCIGGQFMVAVATQSVSIRKNLLAAWTYPKKSYKRPTVTINGEQLPPNNWTYIKKQQLALPHSRKIARKIYNAAIRGDEIEVDFDGKKPFTLNLPKPNVDFADFGAECGLGRKKA